MAYSEGRLENPRNGTATIEGCIHSRGKSESIIKSFIQEIWRVTHNLNLRSNSIAGTAK